MLKHKLLCNLMLLALLLPTWGLIVLAAKPPAPIPATSKGPVQDMIDSGLTRKQAIAYLSLIRDSKGRKIKNFSKYKGKEYRFTKGKPSYKRGKARLNAWLKWHRSHKKHTKVSAKPAKKQDTAANQSSGQVNPTPTPTPTPTPASKKQEEPTQAKKVEKKVVKIDLPVATLTLPINNLYDVPPAKVIYNDGTFEWMNTKDNVKSSNESIVSIGKNGHTLNLNKQGESDLIYKFGESNAKLHVIVGPENHRIKNMLFLAVLFLILLGIVAKLLNWQEKRQFSKHVIIEDAETNPEPAADPKTQANGVATGTGPAAAP